MVNLFRGPNLIEDVATTMRRLEEGDLKLRVRALDSERALTRVLVRHPACIYQEPAPEAQCQVVLQDGTSFIGMLQSTHRTGSVVGARDVGAKASCCRAERMPWKVPCMWHGLAPWPLRGNRCVC